MPIALVTLTRAGKKKFLEEEGRITSIEQPTVAKEALMRRICWHQLWHNHYSYVATEALDADIILGNLLIGFYK